MIKVHTLNYLSHWICWVSLSSIYWECSISYVIISSSLLLLMLFWKVRDWKKSVLDSGTFCRSNIQAIPHVFCSWKWLEYYNVSSYKVLDTDFVLSVRSIQTQNLEGHSQLGDKLCIPFWLFLHVMKVVEIHELFSSALLSSQLPIEVHFDGWGSSKMIQLLCIWSLDQS